MIQRIQTVYLLIAAILICLLFFAPFAEITAGQSIYQFDIKGIYLVGVQKIELISSGLFITILSSVTVSLLILTIFRYKNRQLQMRLSVIIIFLMLGISALTYFTAWTAAKTVAGIINLEIAFVFPLIAAVLAFMAYRAINKDELLIRSIDRIR